MNFPVQIVDIISKLSPVLGGALGGPAGSLIGYVISKTLGVDMDSPDDLSKKIEQDPCTLDKLKEIELQVSDLQNARIEASKDTGISKVVRPLLALFAMLAIFADIILIDYVNNDIVKQILIVMLVCLVWDVRQIYRFYFGSGDDLPDFMSKIKKRF